jgi:uncharacterized protein YodC (DUF2158 family)
VLDLFTGSGGFLPPCQRSRYAAAILTRAALLIFRRFRVGRGVAVVSQAGKAALTGKFMIWCDWFDGQKKMSEAFPPESLKLSGTSRSAPQ